LIIHKAHKIVLKGAGLCLALLCFNIVSLGIIHTDTLIIDGITLGVKVVNEDEKVDADASAEKEDSISVERDLQFRAQILSGVNGISYKSESSTLLLDEFIHGSSVISYQPELRFQTRIIESRKAEVYAGLGFRMNQSTFTQFADLERDSLFNFYSSGEGDLIQVLRFRTVGGLEYDSLDMNLTESKSTRLMISIPVSAKVKLKSYKKSAIFTNINLQPVLQLTNYNSDLSVIENPRISDAKLAEINPSKFFLSSDISLGFEKLLKRDRSVSFSIGYSQDWFRKFRKVSKARINSKAIFLGLEYTFSN